MALFPEAFTDIRGFYGVNSVAEEKYKVIIVGGGPAGLAAGMTLARSGVGDVLLLERGSHSGSKNVMGGILFTPSLEKLVPEIWKAGAPLERPVTRRTFAILSEDSSAEFSFRCAAFGQPPYNHAFTVLRGRFDRWLASKAEAAGLAILNGVVVDGLVRDGMDKVIGVRTRVEEGADQAEGVLLADLVILAEGANALIAEREGLRPKILPQDMAVSVKEIVSLPEQVLADRFSLEKDGGEGREYYGAAVKGLFGSGYIYTNRESLSVGVAVSVKDLTAAVMTPNDLLEHFKSHPAVRPLLEGGRVLEYSAHMIPEGGYYRLGRLFADGVLVAGDAAGLVNVSPYHEGANLAVASGIMAAETAMEALAKGDVGAGALAAYKSRLEESFVLKDMAKFADMPGFFRENPQALAAWPESFLGMLRDLFTVSEEPKQELEGKALARFQREVGPLPFLLFLWGLRGATKSVYYESTSKLIDYVKRNW